MRSFNCLLERKKSNIKKISKMTFLFRSGSLSKHRNQTVRKHAKIQNQVDLKVDLNEIPLFNLPFVNWLSLVKLDTKTPS